MDEIKFDAKYKDWLVSKKLEITDKTQPKDVARMLADISQEIGAKSFQLSGVNTSLIEEYAKKLVGTKKGHEGVADVFHSMKPGEVNTELLKACPEERLLPLAKAYLNQAIFEQVKINSFIRPDLVEHVYGKRE